MVFCGALVLLEWDEKGMDISGVVWEKDERCVGVVGRTRVVKIFDLRCFDRFIVRLLFARVKDENSHESLALVFLSFFWSSVWWFCVRCLFFCV